MKSFLSKLKKLWNFKVIASVIIIILSYQVYSIQRIISPVKDKSEGIIDELTTFRNQTATFAGDLNEIREYLLLPTRNYASGESNEPSEEDLKAAILSFIGAVGNDADKTDKISALQAKVQSVVDNQSFQTLISEKGVSFFVFYPKYDGENYYNFLAIKDAELGPLAYVQGNLVDGSFLVDAFSGKEQLGTELGENLINLIGEKKDSWLEARKLVLDRQNYINGLLKSNEIATKLQAKALKFIDKPDDTVDAFVYKIDGQYGNALTVGVIKGSSDFFIEQAAVARKNYNNQDSFKADLLLAVDAVDVRSPIERLVLQKKQVLDSLFNEESFKFFLQEFGGSLTSQAKEDADRYIYALFRADKELGSIVLEKGTGKIKVLRSGEAFAVDVFDFSSDSKKKT